MSLTEERLQLADPFDSDPDDTEMDGFDPEARRLRLSIPLPPPDNHCHSSGMGRRFATAPYRDWLSLAARRLREVLGPWPADGEEWWGVEVWLWMGSRSDGPNHLKPLLDLLGGSYVPEKGERGPDGKLLDRDKIQKTTRGLFLNDKRIRWATPHVLSTRCDDPRCVVVAFPVPAPTDERAEAEAAERTEKERLKLEAQQAREEAAEAARVAKERERAEAQAYRERERAAEEECIVSELLAHGVRDKIPGRVLEEVRLSLGSSTSRIRDTWRRFQAGEIPLPGDVQDKERHLLATTSAKAVAP